jgi:hypothetical protein
MSNSVVPTWTACVAAIEQQLATCRPDLDALALAYAEAAGRTRRRQMPIPARYRYPRGRQTDRIPVATALAVRVLPPAS